MSADDGQGIFGSVITRLKVEGFGCIRKVAVPLTPLHAFVGPNDAGKSLLLRAALIIGRLAQLSTQKEISIEPDTLPFDRTVPFRMHAELPNRLLFEVVVDPASTVCKVHVGSGSKKHTVLHISRNKARHGAGGPTPKELWLILNALAGALMLSLDAGALRRDSPLIPPGTKVSLDERGGGLASVFDAIAARGDDSLLRITHRIRTFFPHIKTLRVPASSATTKAIRAELVDGTELPAAHMGNGLLNQLAFEALQHMDRPALLLVEQPERDLAPPNLREVVRILRSIAEDRVRPAQVLLVTHSPLVLDELRAEEITVVTRDARFGTRGTPLLECRAFDEREDGEPMGKVWVRHAAALAETRAP